MEKNIKSAAELKIALRFLLMNFQSSNLTGKQIFKHMTKILKFLLLSIASGVVLAFSFPKINIFCFAFVAFIPIIYVALSNKFTKSLLYGFVFGFVFWAVSLFWMMPFLSANVGEVQAVIISVLFWCYLSLYFSVWTGILSYVKDHFNPVQTSFFASFVWVTLEVIRSYFLTGFGWNLLGYSQASFVCFIQIADILGVYGISFVIIFINTLIFYWLKTPDKKAYLLTALTIFLLISAYGYVRLNKYKFNYGDKISVGVVQPNVNQYKKWDKNYSDENLASLTKNLKLFKDKNLDLVVYPETVLTEYFGVDKKTENFIREVASLGKLNLIGSLFQDENYSFYNSVFAVKNDALAFGRHDKNHLVVFGEYIPFRDILAKYFKVFNTMGDFAKGGRMDIFEFDDIRVGPTICSENFFPEYSRELVTSGAKILTNHTNDGWFFDTAAPYQHFVMNVFRAVENRKNIIVSANNGISAIIGCNGKAFEKTYLNETSYFISDAYQNSDITVYDNAGYIFPYLCIFMTIFLFILILL